VEVEVEKGRVVSRVEQEGDANQRRSSCEDAEGEVYEERKNSRCHHDLIHVDALVIGANAVSRITLLPISFFFLNTLSLSLPIPIPTHLPRWVSGSQIMAAYLGCPALK
jgi:hypothetical protein